MQATKTFRTWRRSGAIGAALVAALAAGCDNPVRGEPHEEEVAGVSIRQGTTEVARYFDGAVTGALPTTAAGAHSATLTVVFLDEEGHALDLSGESDHYLRARSANTAVADFEVSGWGGQVHGESAGSTTIIFDLMHGTPPSGHADFSTLGIPVTVTAAP